MKSMMEVLATRMESWDQEVRQELVIYKVVVSAQVMATDATHDSLALKAYQQNLYLKYYY